MKILINLGILFIKYYFSCKDNKRRNKRTPNVVPVLDFLGEKSFYKCIKLNNIYNQLSKILKEDKVNYASNIIDESSMKISLSTLKKIRENTTFDDYNFLPMYNSNLKNDNTLIDYLKNKLGPENSMVIVEVDDRASLNDINSNNKLSRNQKIFIFHLFQFYYTHFCLVLI